VLSAGDTVGSVAGAVVASVVGAVVGSVVGEVVALVVGTVVATSVAWVVDAVVSFVLAVASMGVATSGADVSTCGATQHPTTKTTNAIMLRNTFFLGRILLMRFWIGAMGRSAIPSKIKRTLAKLNQ